MRDILFQGRRFDGIWVNGYLFAKPILEKYFIILGENQWMVHPESIGQFTGMTEFVMADKSIHEPLFEGDIVEVWSRRRTPYEYIYNQPQSQYDVDVKARATIVFRSGRWKLDYDNNYNQSMCKLKGNEQIERTVNACRELYDYGYHDRNEDWHREHNNQYKWRDIVKIGNKFDTPELLEGKV